MRLFAGRDHAAGRIVHRRNDDAVARGFHSRSTQDGLRCKGLLLEVGQRGARFGQLADGLLDPLRLAAFDLLYRFNYLASRRGEFGCNRTYLADQISLIALDLGVFEMICQTLIDQRFLTLEFILDDHELVLDRLLLGTQADQRLVGLNLGTRPL